MQSRKHPWWMADIDRAFKKADVHGRNEILLVPMFVGQNVVYHYALQDGVLQLQKRKGRIMTLPPRWGGSDVKHVFVYGKLVKSPADRTEFIALAVLLNDEHGFNEKRNQLLELNLLAHAGFKTALPYSRVVKMDGLTYAAINQQFATVKEAVNQRKVSLWSDSTHGWFPEPVGLQAFPV